MMRKKIISLVLVIFLLLSVMPILVRPVSANSQTYWEATLPYESTLLNQTLRTSKSDTYPEVALTTNLYKLEKDYPQPGQYEFALAVVAAANSRHTMDYVACPPRSAPIYEPANTLSLGDNEGAMVDIGSYNLNYYGAWYRRIFVSSNGFVVLDTDAYNDHGGQYTSPVPIPIPSTAEPNILIAPFWRDLDPTRGGRIKYGFDLYGKFVVAWIDVPNKINSNTQTFAVSFELGFSELGVGPDIYFTYGAITNDVPTSVGIEDQYGKRGLSIASVSSGQWLVLQHAYYLECITDIKVSASKLTDSGDNDNLALIRIDGLNSTLPGGVNVQLSDSSEGKYRSYPLLSCASVVLDVLGLVTGSGLLGVAGLALGVADLAFQVSPMPSSTVNEANSETQTAFVSSRAFDENRPDYMHPWDAAVFALFRWRLLSTSVNHRLVLNVQVDYGYPRESRTLTSDNIELKLTPGSASWYGRTNPDGHGYDFYPISTPYGPIYHIDTVNSNDYGYQALGWSKLIGEAAEDYKAGADGRLRVKGAFRQIDTFPSDLQPGRRLLNIYIMYSENINNIVKVVQVLDYSDGTEWKYIDVIVDGLIAGKPVKVGIGRPDAWQFNWSLIAEWFGIEIIEGVGNPPFPPLIPSAPSGPSSGWEGFSYTYSTSTTDLDNDYLYYQFYWGDGTTTTVGPYASGATASASHYWATEGTYGVMVRAQDSTGLWSGWSSSLIVYMHHRGGGGGGPYCPFASVWNGSSYVLDNNVLPRSVLSNETDVEDFYRLEQTPTRTDGKYMLRLSEPATDHTYFDKVSLLAVDHQSDVNIAVAPGGEILTYKNPTPPISAVDNNGNDTLSEISLIDGDVSNPATYFQGFPNDYLILNFGKVESDTAKLILRDDMKKQIDECILVQVKNGSNAWQTVETLVPRAYWSMEAVDLSSYVVQDQDFTVRLYWLQTHRIDFVGLDTTPQANYDLRSGTLVSATHSAQGDVKTQLLENDNVYAELVSGQQIQLEFTLPNNTKEARTYILYTKGHYTTTP